MASMRSWYSWLLATSEKATDAVVALEAKLFLQRCNEGAKHVQ